MPEPGGKDDLKIGHKIVEEMEKYLKDVKQYLTDPNYKNCKDLGSYILEKKIPDLLDEALEYIGHSDTYKRDHDNELIHQRTSFSSELNHPDPDCSLEKFMIDHDNISYKLIDENKGNKTIVYANNNNSKEFSTNHFVDENLKIDVTTLILKNNRREYNPFYFLQKKNVFIHENFAILRSLIFKCIKTLLINI